MATLTDVRGAQERPSRAAKAAARWFFFAMALTMAAIVAYGFSTTVTDNLIRPKVPRPPILYAHAAVMTAWISLFIVQASLARARKVSWHRAFGLAFLVIGLAVPLIGVPTAFVMRRFDIVHFHHQLPFIAIPLSDMVNFSTFFGLAVWWRKAPEFHRRLMFLATVSLIDAGLGRFPVPDAWFQAGWYYLVMDGLVGLAMVRDLITIRRIHPVFAWGLPFLIVVQATTLWLWHSPPAPWLALMRSIVGAG